MKLQHFCTTTYIFNEEGNKTLLIFHKKIAAYLPPGGHIEENEDYFESSQREVVEELGVKSSYLSYPEYLNGLEDKTMQPWAIQKYEIIPEKHYHFDLIFVAITSEDIKIIPRDGESMDFRWFNVDEISKINTTKECRSNIIRMSLSIKNHREGR